MCSLATLLREGKDDILREWETRARSLPAASELSELVLYDHFPQLLQVLAEAVSRRDETARPLEDVPIVHAAERLQEGYDLRQVIAEYRLLRDVIATAYARLPTQNDETLAMRMEQLRVLNEALDRAITDAIDHYAVERDRSREMFVSILGHDLRTPLNAIALAAQLLRRRGEHLDPRDLKLAERIAASSERMARMIGDLLDLARGHLGGGLPITPKAIDVRPLIAQAVQELADAHPERDIRCNSERVSGNFEGQFDGDRIVQAISNLVGNAIQHGQDPIVVEPKDRGDVIELEVKNVGTIVAGVRSRLFDAFVTTAQNDPQRVGLGLGLYIVREIARAHGGEVKVDATADATSFCLVLPRRAAAPESRRRALPSE